MIFTSPSFIAVLVAASVGLLPLVGAAKNAEIPKKPSSVAASEQVLRNNYALQIDGMHCQGCVDSLTRELQKLPAVEPGSVKVSLKDNKAVLQLKKTEKLSVEQVTALVSQAVKAAGDEYVVKKVQVL